jgi:hypothetical protein
MRNRQALEVKSIKPTTACGILLSSRRGTVKENHWRSLRREQLATARDRPQPSCGSGQVSTGTWTFGLGSPHCPSSAAQVLQEVLQQVVTFARGVRIWVRRFSRRDRGQNCEPFHAGEVAGVVGD